MAATFLHSRAGGPAGRWSCPQLVFVCTFIQAAVGHAQNLSAHVPGALGLTVGIVWITSWAFQRHHVA